MKSILLFKTPVKLAQIAWKSACSCDHEKYTSKEPITLRNCAFVICCLVNLPMNLKELQTESFLLLLRLEQELTTKTHRSSVL